MGRWYPPLLVWHVLAYAILVVATLSAAMEAGTPARVGAVLVPSALLAAWYAYWMVLRVDRVSRRNADAYLYLSVAACLWAILLAVDPRYSMLSIVGFVQLYGYLPWRAAVTGAAVMTLLFTVSRGWRGGLGSERGLQWVGLSVMDVVWPVIVLVVTAAFFLFVRDTASQSAERQRLLQQLQAARAELAQAERHAGMLQERERLAAELHDTLAQELSSIVMLLEAAQTSVGTASQPAAAEHLTHALRAARDSLRQIRRVVWSLRPEALERGTLVEALERLAADVSRDGSWAVRLQVVGDQHALATETQVTLLRVAQEALANARRHARADAVTLTLSFADDRVVLDVRDDGAGFDPARVEPGSEIGHHLGLVAMRERVEALGGRLTIETAPGAGTTVVAAIPAHQSAHHGTGSTP